MYRFRSCSCVIVVVFDSITTFPAEKVEAGIKHDGNHSLHLTELFNWVEFGLSERSLLPFMELEFFSRIQNTNKVFLYVSLLLISGSRKYQWSLSLDEVRRKMQLVWTCLRLIIKISTSWTANSFSQLQKCQYFFLINNHSAFGYRIKKQQRYSNKYDF